CQQFNSLPFTF
nr:immunoglobulin light chain junction region [Macaca mulatta]MOX53138.1 immunoglobulin light chain junction region [Macaca mulatta]MOX56216.1 immunoglobulin light chain junction region [Macaca mulatta]MOY10594.1 immunoglobulin light chain junction region [Macaca mulatta]